ncbi:MAG: sugar transferase [Chlorobi bacterium]|nr:sugar transferase [Chlorobiota bacterium]
MYKLVIKQVIDFLLALMGFLLLSPIFIIISIILLYSNRGKLFFFQQRPGKNEKLFKIIKFRTMNDKKDKHGNLLPDVERITKIGEFIRKNSLDEIPQLLNVIKGDMSIVGPRPLLDFYLPLYNKYQAQRHNVKPGITGWAQVNGRNAITWNKKFEYDVYYVNNLSFQLDIKILFKTIKKVLFKEGVNNDDKNFTMPYFTGNEDE